LPVSIDILLLLLLLLQGNNVLSDMDDDDDGLKPQKFLGFVEGPKHGYVHKVNFLQRPLSLNSFFDGQ